MTEELFELELWGGPAEARYRRWRPEIEALPWTDLSGLVATEAERVAARRGWTAVSLQEYATAAAHAVTTNLLIQLRAPLDLSALASRFALDELAHAELCARMANATGGGAPLTYRAEDLFPAPPTGPNLLRLVTERIVRDCCVSETLATPLLHLVSQGPGPELLRQVQRAILRDERVHGRFGWLFLEWAAPRLTTDDREALRQAASEEIGKHRALWAALHEQPPEVFSIIGSLGGIGAEAYAQHGAAALEARVLVPLRTYGLAP